VFLGSAQRDVKLSCTKLEWSIDGCESAGATCRRLDEFLGPLPGGIRAPSIVLTVALTLKERSGIEVP